MDKKDKYIVLCKAVVDDIGRMYSNCPELDKNVRHMIGERLSVLDKLAVAHISSSLSSEARQELEKLIADPAHFIDSTRYSFTIVHPMFLEYLKEHGLTDWEVGCCCLYCIGLNGSEISCYLNRPSMYNVSRTIRKKLEIERRTNIDTFLRGKMLELDK